jgi:hypothetical protein
MRFEGGWLKMGFPWGRPLYQPPLFLAIGAAALAIALAVFATFAEVIPGEFLWVERSSAGWLIGAAGVVATTGAILTGIGEFAEAFPKQLVRVFIVTSINTNGETEMAVVAMNSDVFVAGFRLDAFILDSDGHVMQPFPSLLSDSAWLPQGKLQRSISAPSGAARVRCTWATDRNRGITEREFAIEWLGAEPPVVAT